MLNVVEKSEELESPAETIEELLQRLALQVGRTLMIEGRGVWDSHREKWRQTPRTFVGELQWLGHIYAQDHIELNLGKPLFGPDDKRQFVSIEAKVSVLLDGRWKIVHDGPIPEDHRRPSDG